METYQKLNQKIITCHHNINILAQTFTITKKEVLFESLLFFFWSPSSLVSLLVGSLVHVGLLSVFKAARLAKNSEFLPCTGRLANPQSLQLTNKCILGVPPPQDSSHHQDDITFLVGDPNLNLHLPQFLGGGTTQGI